MKSIGVRVESETDIVYLCYCPYHGNNDTPSFAVNKTEGLFICYNPACARSGSLTNLIKTIGKLDDFAAKRLIVKSKRRGQDIQDQLISLVEPTETFPEYHDPRRPNYMAEVKRDFWKYTEPQLYMKGRGFERETMEKFEIGYDSIMDMVCVPMHDPMGKVEIGAVRRSIEGKVFKNTPGLPSSKTLFNLHRAKRAGETCIIVESSMDVMRLDQLGYANSAALLMGHFNSNHVSLLNKYFNTIIIMADYDDRTKHVYKKCGTCRKEGSNLCKGHNPGEELGMKIADMMVHKNILWAHYGGSTRFPPGAKDPGDMDDEAVIKCIKNAVSHIEYALDL